MKIYVYYATQAPLGVILARYNATRHHYKMFLWHTDTDIVEPGQWLMKKKIWPRYCSLSPDGTRFQYFMAQFVDPFDTYTILSKPPYFTAIKLREETGTWTAGSVNWTGSGVGSGPSEIDSLPGKTVVFKDDKLIVNNNVIVDFCDYSFEKMEPPNDYPQSNLNVS